MCSDHEYMEVGYNMFTNSFAHTGLIKVMFYMCATFQ